MRLAAKRIRFTLFTKFPEPGKAKTRLIPLLGAEAAAHLQQRMTEHAVNQLRRFVCKHPYTDVVINYQGGPPDGIRHWLGNDINIRPQCQGSLGVKMACAMSEAFSAGYMYCFIIGADCPGINQDQLSTAVQNRDNNTVVIGPVIDGGYWIIGMSRAAFAHLQETVFRAPDIPWSTNAVYQLTRRRIQEENCRIAALNPLSDVDDAADVPVYERTMADSPLFGPRSPRISIVIPALNESGHIRKTIHSAKRGLNTEIIVVDGGSSDNTQKAAEDEGALVIRSEPGRALQMNRGITRSTGDILLFLHADTILPLGFDTHVREVVWNRGYKSGAFRLRVSSVKKRIRFVVWCANMRSRFLHLPYGDQALFIEKGTLTAVNGYPDVPIMEDFILIRNLRRHGRKPVLLPVPVTTSSRRWDKTGVLRTLFINQLMVAGYYAGIPLRTLAAWYHR